MSWYQDVISNPFGLAGGEAQWGGHSGIDFGTPNDTPLFFPMGGKVIAADYKPLGGEVAVDTGQGVIEYFLHLDQINVQVGQNIQAGDVIGTSGGGVGDKILNALGQVITVVTQSQYGSYSTGYHTHFGLVKGDSLAAYQASLGSNTNRIDPTNFISVWRSSGNVAAASTLGISTNAHSGDGSQLMNTDQTTTLSYNPVQDGINAVVNPIVTNAESGITKFIEIGMLLSIALIAIGFGFFLLMPKQNIGASNSNLQTASTVAKLAAA